MKSNNISKERKEYLNKLRKEKLYVFITQIFILVAFIIIWELLANMEIIDSFITSKPSRILATFINLKSNELINHIAVTTFETIVGFLVGTVLGIIIAILLWWSKFLEKALDPYLVVLNSLPKVALRTNYYFMGRSRNTCNYRNGYGNIFSSYNIRNFEWF